MNLLRIYLLSGLVAHKAVWELLKRRQLRSNATTDPLTRSLPATVIKLLKVGILLGIIVQTMLPEIAPIEIGSDNLRIVGVALFTVGLIVAITSRVQLGNNWSDIESATILDADAVISNGIYGYIRHPIYVGDLLLLIGLELSLNSWLVAAVLLTLPVVLWKAVREEKMLADKLPGYHTYCLRTKRFIPYLI